MNQAAKSQQIEFEVFPKDTKSNYSYLSDIKEDVKHGQPAVNLVFSTQSIIVIFICLLMSLVASFSLGVEKGKLIAKNNTMSVRGTNPSETGQEAKSDPEPGASVEKAPAAQNAQTALITMPVQNIPAAAGPAAGTTTALGAASIQKEGYAIQIASLTSENSARNLAESLIKKGTPSYTKPSGKYIVVLAGNFASREEAQAKLKELKKTYTDCFIKKI